MPKGSAKALEAARAAAKAKRDAGEKIEHRNPLEKLADNPLSKSLAIAAKCYDCQGQDADPCVKWRIGNCRTKTCPLWAVRPYQQTFGRPTPKALLQQFESQPQ